MSHTRFPTVAFLSLVLLLATQGPVLAERPPSSRTLVIGVDHTDAANQQPEKFRLFEYTDFFSRTVRVRTGDTLDFRTAPGAFHIVAMARSEDAARDAYPIALLDRDDPPAVGSGKPKIELGPSNGSITNGSAHGGGTIGDPNAFPPTNCGLVQFGQAPCTFRGGDDVESAGGVAGFGQTGPAAVDWQITIDARPGSYAYFCFIHPGMRGRLTVVGGEHADDATDVTSQAQIDAASGAQFQDDREDALEAERAADVVRFTGGAPGTRTYHETVGLSAAENHVAIDEMLPHTLNLDQGDRVEYQWRDPHNVHTVGFPPAEPPLPGPFIPDTFDGPATHEVIGDPGNAAPGTLLTVPSAVVDAGLRIGTAYGLQPTSQTWSVRTNAQTSSGTFAWQCTVHDFMHGELHVSP